MTCGLRREVRRHPRCEDGERDESIPHHESSWSWFTLSRSLPIHPFPDVARAVAQLHPICFAADQESDDRNVDQPHFVEIKDDGRPVSRHAAPQLAHMLGVDPSADPEHDRDLESHRWEWANVAPASGDGSTATYDCEQC